MEKEEKLSKFTGFCRIGDVSFRFNDALRVPLAWCFLENQNRSTPARAMEALKVVKKFAQGHQVQVPFLINGLAMVVAPKSPIIGLIKELKELEANRPIGNQCRFQSSEIGGFLALEEVGVVGQQGKNIELACLASNSLGNLNVPIPIFVQFIRAHESFADIIVAINPRETPKQIEKKLESQKKRIGGLKEFDSRPYC